MNNLSFLTKKQTLTALESGELLVNKFSESSYQKTPNLPSDKEFQIVFLNQYQWQKKILTPQKTINLKQQRQFLTKKLGPYQCKVRYRHTYWVWGLIYKKKFTITVACGSDGVEFLIDSQASLSEAIEVTNALSTWLNE